MNLKSKILKLSIILMFVLVLIPVASAMDSDESFYQEYETASDIECQDYEGVVEEYGNWQVVDAQEEISSDSDYDGFDEIDTEYSDQSQPQADNEDNIINVAEFEENSVIETHEIINEDTSVDEVEYEISSQNVDDILNNINENSVEDLTIESIVNQGSILISKYDDEVIVNCVKINQILSAEMESTELTNLNRNIDKVLELKNNLLLKQDVQATFSGVNINELEDIVSCMNYINTDFAYSIDNSIVGNHAGIFFAGQSCFIKLSPCFAATFCDFLSVECFFFGDFIIASGIFCDFVVEYSQCNLCLIEFLV